MSRAVFLDRDGVLNPSVHRRGRARAPLTLEEFRPFPWAAAAVRALQEAGFLCLVVTNQPDVATGELAAATLAAMHERLARETGVDCIYACVHAGADRCACRKPLPGMLLHAAEDWDVRVADSFMVGDRATDVEAGRAAGCATVLVDGPEPGRARPDFRARDLRDAVTTILSLQEALR
jgi:D-glycero-D-manno-heptose 1,7-bisphosphate phosphatase